MKKKNDAMAAGRCVAEIVEMAAFLSGRGFFATTRLKGSLLIGAYSQGSGLGINLRTLEEIKHRSGIGDEIRIG